MAPIPIDWEALSQAKRSAGPSAMPQRVRRRSASLPLHDKRWSAVHQDGSGSCCWTALDLRPQALVMLRQRRARLPRSRTSIPPPSAVLGAQWAARCRGSPNPAAFCDRSSVPRVTALNPLTSGDGPGQCSQNILPCSPGHCSRNSGATHTLHSPGCTSMYTGLMGTTSPSTAFRSVRPRGPGHCSRNSGATHTLHSPGCNST